MFGWPEALLVDNCDNALPELTKLIDVPIPAHYMSNSKD